jgi:hypothetical protein
MHKLSGGNSSVGRAQPCQGWGRGFKSRFPLNKARVAELCRKSRNLRFRTFSSILENSTKAKLWEFSGVDALDVKLVTATCKVK